MKAKVLKRVKFSLPAQRGKQVSVAGSFNQWDPQAAPLRWSAKTSAYYTYVMLAPGRYEYKFVIDGHWCIDPYCPEWVPNRVGSLNSVLRVP